MKDRKSNIRVKMIKQRKKDKRERDKGGKRIDRGG